jgi:hypothetical protein
MKILLLKRECPPRLMDILYYFVFLIPINPAIINAIPKKYTYLPLSIK